MRCPICGSKECCGGDPFEKVERLERDKADLIEKAEMAIAAWDWCQKLRPAVLEAYIETLRIVVERMKDEEYWGDEPSPGRITAKDAWITAQKAERERIKQIVAEVGRQGNHDKWFDCADAIAERIEEKEE